MKVDKEIHGVQCSDHLIVCSCITDSSWHKGAARSHGAGGAGGSAHWGREGVGLEVLPVVVLQAGWAASCHIHSSGRAPAGEEASHWSADRWWPKSPCAEPATTEVPSAITCGPVTLTSLLPFFSCQNSCHFFRGHYYFKYVSCQTALIEVQPVSQAFLCWRDSKLATFSLGWSGRGRSNGRRNLPTTHPTDLHVDFLCKRDKYF